MTLFGKKKPILKKARKRDMPDGLWIKCPGCNEMIFREEQEKALHVCPLCDHHFPMSRAERLAMLADPGSFVEWDRDLYSIDFLGFVGEASYQEKLEANRRKTGEVDAVTCGRARLKGRAIALGVMDFEFLGASMGSVVGEKITRLIERGTAENLPVILVCASGGARMYEGMMSLMQMAKTSG
ncbi:MAG TPA: acetyl-CoA carboxylase carboxyltransferase subunit beta, partial [Kiritimatiellia bacterium]|nr:acetyl-CoA carboxylase carboxyltransferase subunit beta [Kiritimatiellia bacterium]